MKFTEFISTHHVFSTQELLRACDSATSAKQQLWHAARLGKVEMVRRGVYVSYTGRFQGSVPDPAEVALACDRKAVLCYHSALTAFGVEHNIFFQCDFMSNIVKKPFSYRGIRYVPHRMDESAKTCKVRISSDLRMNCTSKEQTIVDCMDQPWLAGGAEEVIRALTLLAYIDVKALVEILENKGAPSKARAGWLLETMRDAWSIDSAILDSLHASLGKGPYRFGRPRIGESSWNSYWKLLLPQPLNEVRSWISR